MIVAFWTLAALVGYAYAGYPIFIGVLGVLFGRRVSVDEALRPSVSILIPAYNEEKVIEAKLRNTLALDYPAGRVQILVASESTDTTDAIVAAFAGEGVRLLPSPVRRGKVANLHRAVPSATGEILVFTDANAMLRPDALIRLVRNFADPRVGAVSGALVYVDPAPPSGPFAPPAAAVGETAYWSFERVIKEASSRLGSLPGANGSLFALRRGLYSPISESRGDDFELPIRVILQGYDSVLEPEAVSVEAASRRYRDEYRRKVRIINWMSASAWILLREAISNGRWLLAFQLVSHKLNRWAVPFWLALFLPVSISLAPRGSVYMLAAVGQGVLYGLALSGAVVERAGHRAPGVLGLPLYFVMVNAASFIGLITRMAGRDAAWHKRAD